MMESGFKTVSLSKNNMMDIKFNGDDFHSTLDKIKTLKAKNHVVLGVGKGHIKNL